MYPIEIQNKILSYNIHQVAELLKPVINYYEEPKNNNFHKEIIKYLSENKINFSCVFLKFCLHP